MPLSFHGSCLVPNDPCAGAVVGLPCPTARGPEVAEAGERLLDLARGQRPGRGRRVFTTAHLAPAAARAQLAPLHARLRDMGRQLLLTNLAPQVVKTLEVTRLHTLLDVLPAEPA